MKFKYLIFLFLFYPQIANAEGIMLVLHGMQDRYGNTPIAEIEKYACRYAELKGYDCEVIPISGSLRHEQKKAAIARIKRGGITALYGFSAGGYLIPHLINDLPSEFKKQIQDITILGAPGVSEIKGIPTHIIKDPPQGHMKGPKILTEQTEIF